VTRNVHVQVGSTRLDKLSITHYSYIFKVSCKNIESKHSIGYVHGGVDNRN